MKHLLLIYIFIFQTVFGLLAQTNITDSIVHQNFQRKFMVHLPPSFNLNKKRALVINLHGGSGNMVNAQGFSMLNPVADQHDFVVAWPQGFGIAPPGFSWADGRNTSADMAGIDDVGFINKLADTLTRRFNLNTDRIYLCGFSNGGFMVQRMACQSPERFAAMASLGSSMDTVLYKHCFPEKSIPVAFFNGTSDPAMPYYGGPLQNPLVIPVVPVDSTVQFWVRHNKCKSTQPLFMFPDIFPSDNSTAELYTYTDCDCDADVRFYKLINGGHTWPGVYVASQASVLGNTNRDINAGQELWSFFSSFSQCETSAVNDDIQESSAFRIFPNPADDILHIVWPEDKKYSLQVFDSFGRSVLKSGPENQLNIQHFPSGLYTITLRSAKDVFSQKFIKQ